MDSEIQQAKEEKEEDIVKKQKRKKLHDFIYRR
jgi:hypothetical protein